jgi:hypothetical protein
MRAGMAGILLVVLKADRSNDVVQAVRDAAGFLAGPVRQPLQAGRPARGDGRQLGDRAPVWYALGRAIARLVLR